MSASEIAARDAALNEPWGGLRRQREAATFGLWVFIGSELLFFSGALLAYATYRTLWPQEFAAAGRETDIVYGTVNTAILLTSSLTMAAAADGARAGLRRMVLICLGITAALGFSFLVVKGFEYAEDIRENLLPGPGFKLADHPPAQIFFAFYWLLTAVHALHMSVGIGATLTMLVQGWRGTRPMPSPGFEAVALYWHLVDLVWVFLYPLLYLMGRTS